MIFGRQVTSQSTTRQSSPTSPRTSSSRSTSAAPVFVYPHTEPRHVHYSPLEAMVVGTPTLYLRGALIGVLTDGADLPGACADIAEMHAKAVRPARRRPCPCRRDPRQPGAGARAFLPRPRRPAMGGGAGLSRRSGGVTAGPLRALGRRLRELCCRWSATGTCGSSSTASPPGSRRLEAAARAEAEAASERDCAARLPTPRRRSRDRRPAVARRPCTRRLDELAGELGYKTDLANEKLDRDNFACSGLPARTAMRPRPISPRSARPSRARSTGWTAISSTTRPNCGRPSRPGGTPAEDGSGPGALPGAAPFQ